MQPGQMYLAVNGANTAAYNAEEVKQIDEERDRRLQAATQRLEKQKCLLGDEDDRRPSPVSSRIQGPCACLL